MDEQARKAIEALKVTGPSPDSPLPWQRLYGHLCDANRDPVKFHHLGEIHSDGGNAEYAMCAVNAAPHLLARVAELEAIDGERTALADLHILCADAGIPPGHIVARVGALVSALEAARVVVEGLPELQEHHPRCATRTVYLLRDPPINQVCDCGAGAVNAARAATRLALGLEVKP